MACSKWKWTSVATVSDLCPTTVKILTHLISRYQLPLSNSGVKLVCNVKIVYGNLKSENYQDYTQKPQRNCTFMNSASTLFFQIPGPIRQVLQARAFCSSWARLVVSLFSIISVFLILLLLLPSRWHWIQHSVLFKYYKQEVNSNISTLLKILNS